MTTVNLVPTLMAHTHILSSLSTLPNLIDVTSRSPFTLVVNGGTIVPSVQIGDTHAVERLIEGDVSSVQFMGSGEDQVGRIMLPANVKPIIADLETLNHIGLISVVVSTLEWIVAIVALSGFVAILLAMLVHLIYY